MLDVECRLYRVLFDNGEVRDFVGVNEDATTRGDRMLDEGARIGAKRIAGIADLGSCGAWGRS